MHSVASLPPGPVEVAYEFTASSLSKLSMIYTSTDAFFLGSWLMVFLAVLDHYYNYMLRWHCDDFWLVLAEEEGPCGFSLY